MTGLRSMGWPHRIATVCVSSLLAANAMVVVTGMAADPSADGGVTVIEAATPREVVLITAADGTQIAVDPSTPEGQRAIAEAIARGDTVTTISEDELPDGVVSPLAAKDGSGDVRGPGAGASGVADDAVSTVSSVVADAQDAADDAARSAGSGGSGSGVEPADGVVRTITSVVDDTRTTITSIQRRVEETVDDVVDEVEETVNDVEDTVEDTVDEVEDTVDEVVDEVEDAVEDEADDDDLVERVVTTVTSIVSSVTSPPTTSAPSSPTTTQAPAPVPTTVPDLGL